MSADCHPDCTIGPNADHHGTMSYRCMDGDGNAIPFPGERVHGLRCMTDPCDDCADEMVTAGFARPLDTAIFIPEVHPNTMALNIMAAKVARIREFAEGIIAYEDEHAEGPDTPLRLAFARDILAILEES